MKMKRIAEAVMWLPGFAPDEDPLEVHGSIRTAEVITFPTVQQPVEQPARVVNRIVRPAREVWAMLTTSAFANLSGDVTKFEANLKAIDLLRELECENRAPAIEERDMLHRYTGWGGLSKVFNAEQQDPAWVSRAELLKALLDEQEYEQACASTPNAHYTSPEVIKAMWEMLARLGFKGGRIIEPAAGVGYFIGAMPKEMAENSQVTAVELDLLSSKILKALYKPYSVKVIHGGFEKSGVPSSFYDLAISNVPFGNYQVPELRNVPYQNFLIHDYFFAKALDVVRPGGLVAFITSSGTMDKHDDKVRRYLGSRAKLVGAIRLPNSAFKQIANAEVTTDIIILQKLLAGKADKHGWLHVDAVSTSSELYGEPFHYTTQQLYANKHFLDNPEMVVGKLRFVSNGYSKVTGCVFNGDLETALAEKVQLLPVNVYSAQQEAIDTGKVIQLNVGEQSRPGFRKIDGKLYAITGSEAVLYEASQKAVDRIVGMIEIRDAVRKLINAQPETEEDSLLAVYRTALNVAYDVFQAKHGFIHANANRAAFKPDPDLPLLLSLERWDEETLTAEKADIFYRRTVGVHRRIDRCDSASEALIACVSEHGRIVETRIAELLGIVEEDAMSELEALGLAFHNPDSGEWETADTYLSGNVKQKLSFAQVAGERYSSNVIALESVIPADLSPSEIGIRIGSTWVPTSDYEEFLHDVIGGDSSQVHFSATAGAWHVDGDWRARSSVAATQDFGTSRANAISLFEEALNQRVPTVYDRDPVKDKQVVNQQETIAAREKQQAIKERFVEWVWADDERSERLVRLYNDQFNCNVPRRYDGKHLELPGFSQVYQLHEHQRDSIWRIVTSGCNTLLAHVVGAGKTLEMICGGMESRRLGKASKPMYVVPNHMLEQFAAEFLRAYPGANILMASKDDLQGDKRRHLLSRIATGDWDGVLITHASFERIKMSDEFMEEYIQNEIDLIENAIKESSQSRGNRIVKELARAKKAWAAKLEKLSGTAKKDDLLTFEDLGIDQLFIDEAHGFKNMWRFTKMTRVAGLPNSNSERAFDMFVKTRYIMEKRGGQTGVVFATGTPVSNSMAEMWVMQRYLQPKTLDAFSVGMFDTWAGNFGESVTSLELAPDGSGYRMQTRFARFVNLPELMSMFNQVADIRTAEMLKLPVPKADKETVTTKSTPELKVFVGTLVERAEKIRSGRVRPAEDNMLAVTNDGRKAALDMRLIEPLSLDDEGNKVSLCAEKVHGIWHDTTAFRGTQIVFCDLSTPHTDGRFSVYQELRRKLVEMGIPGTEIAFIHDYDSDAAKADLFKAVREGRIRIVMGSTSKLGVGTNIQTRLVALHHLDAPWRPADVEQREGRIIRQGNLNKEVGVFRYVTEGSFDAYIWQTLETKARFIAQVMQGNSGMRSAEDVELAALSYAEVKALASGNPLVLEKAGIDTELAKLSLLKSQWDHQQWKNKQEMASLPSYVEKQKLRIVATEADIKVRRDVSGPRFQIVVDGQRYSDRVEAGNALMQVVVKQRGRIDSVIGEVAGFEIVLTQSRDYGDVRKVLVIRGAGEYQTGRAETPLGFVKVLENTVHSLDIVLAEQQERLALNDKRLADLTSQVSRKFDKADRLNWLQQRQKEIDAMLDLSKGDLAAADENEQAVEVV